MANKANMLVMEKIQSLDASAATKGALAEIFRTELELGYSDDRTIKKRKIKRCRESIIKGVNNEDI